MALYHCFASVSRQIFNVKNQCRLQRIIADFCLWPSLRLWDCFRHLPCRYPYNDTLVATGPPPFHQFWILETMKNPAESLLEDDHASLGQLLTELDAELARPNITRAFELLDLFWARLAVHIRAENLHLFPALVNAPASLLTGRGSLPTTEEVHNVLAHLRSDHDFFMKELALMIKVMRKITGSQLPSVEEAGDLRQRLTTIATRLEAHNRLEEERVYTWPSLLFDEETIAALRDRLQHELENLPPRFVKNITVECDR